MTRFTKFHKEKIRGYVDKYNVKNGKALDIGCGDGDYFDLFSNNYVGIDKNPDTIYWARKQNRSSCFKVMDATKLEFPDNYFDFIFSVAAFHHISNNDLPKVIQEIYRVIKKDGHAVIIDLVLPKKLRFISYPFFWVDGAVIREREELKRIVTDNGSFEISELFTRYGVYGVTYFELKK